MRQLFTHSSGIGFGVISLFPMDIGEFEVDRSGLSFSANMRCFREVAENDSVQLIKIFYAVKDMERDRTNC